MIQRIAAYVAFSLFCFLLFFYWTFPFDAVKDRVLTAASQKTGAKITAASLEPHWITGFIAKELSILPRNKEEPIKLEELIVRAHVFQFLRGNRAASVRAPVAKGVVDASFVQHETGVTLEGIVEEVELALIPGLKDAIGLSLGGELSIKADVDWNKKVPKESKGVLFLKAKGLESLKGGKVGMFPIPDLAIGDLDWELPLEEGKLKFNKQTLKGENLELILDGDIQLSNPVERSRLNLVFSFKPTEKYLSLRPFAQTAPEQHPPGQGKRRVLLL